MVSVCVSVCMLIYKDRKSDGSKLESVDHGHDIEGRE